MEEEEEEGEKGKHERDEKIMVRVIRRPQQWGWRAHAPQPY